MTFNIDLNDYSGGPHWLTAKGKVNREAIYAKHRADQRHAQAQYEVRQTSREDASTGWRKKERLPAELRAKVKK